MMNLCLYICCVLECISIDMTFAAVNSATPTSMSGCQAYHVINPLGFMIQTSQKALFMAVQKRSLFLILKESAYLVL